MDLVNLLNDGFELYKNFQQDHRVVGSVLAAEVTFLTGDAISQAITDRKLDGRKFINNN